jgi:tRNA(Ile2) C34 agmatinyltransferase TiaS
VEDIKMAFEPNYEKLVTSYKRDLNTAQARVDVRLSTVDQEEIKSILCSSAKAHIINAEISGNTINYNDIEMLEDNPDYFECPECGEECEAREDSDGEKYYWCEDCEQAYDEDGDQIWFEEDEK